jgi:hypothetical protein
MGMSKLRKTTLKKNAGRSAGTYSYTEAQIKYVRWCMKNGVFISMNPDWKTPDEWYIEIKMKNSIHTDPKSYRAEEAFEKLYEYYKHYYTKHHDKI